MTFQSGDVFVNKCFGDLWVMSDDMIVRINTGETLLFETSQGFLKIGHVNELENFDIDFYQELYPCPICHSKQISLTRDQSTLRWKIGCNSNECPCCIHSQIGKYDTRESAIYRWNHRYQ